MTCLTEIICCSEVLSTEINSGNAAGSAGVVTITEMLRAYGDVGLQWVFDLYNTHRSTHTLENGIR